jgi:hypothetical protein
MLKTELYQPPVQRPECLSDRVVHELPRGISPAARRFQITGVAMRRPGPLR